METKITKQEDMATDEGGCKCSRTTERPEPEKKDLLNRLNRIEGQVRGIRNMVEEERYCVDVLTQVSAVQSALNAFNKQLLSAHIKTCVLQRVHEGDDAVIEELCETIKKLMK